MSSGQGHHIFQFVFAVVGSALGPHGKECVTNLGKCWEGQQNYVLNGLTELRCLHAACLKRNTNNVDSFQVSWEGRISLIFLTFVGRKLRQKHVSGESESELQCLGFPGLRLCLHTNVSPAGKDGFQSTWWRSVQASSDQVSSQWPG